MKITYGDIFHKPIIIKQKENEVLKKVILEINSYANNNKDQLLKSGSLPGHILKPNECKIKRFSYVIPFLYMKISFQLISNALSKYFA